MPSQDLSDLPPLLFIPAELCLISWFIFLGQSSFMCGLHGVVRVMLLEMINRSRILHMQTYKATFTWFIYTCTLDTVSLCMPTTTFIIAGSWHMQPLLGYCTCLSPWLSSHGSLHNLITIFHLHRIFVFRIPQFCSGMGGGGRDDFSGRWCYLRGHHQATQTHSGPRFHRGFPLNSREHRFSQYWI